VGRVQVGGGIFLALSCKKDSLDKVKSKRIGDALCVVYPYFLFAKEPMGISGTKLWFSADNPVP